MNPISLTDLLATRSISLLICCLGLSLAACAQTPPWPVPAEESARTPELVDPPGRVGRIAWVSGSVELRSGAERAPAEVNWPVTAGQILSTGRSGRAELRIASANVRLDGESELQIRRLDDGAVALELRRGVMVLTARQADWLNELELSAPRARVELLAPGRYRLEAAPGLTRLGVAQGEARLLAQRMSFVVRSGESGELKDSPQGYASFQISPWRSDDLDEWAAARDRREDLALSRRHVSEEMPGIEALDDFGQWQTHNEFGSVWFPTSVAVDWAPYRFGRWAWVPPWGWTWIDAAPWGFAPFHYGRWVWIGGRWGWVSGRRHPRPVYAPALVVWQGPTGRADWIPLAPGEAYRPWYRNSPGYYGRINHQHAPTDAPPPANYRHESRASTWVRAVEASRPQRPVSPNADPTPHLHVAPSVGDGRKQLPRPMPMPESSPRPGEEARGPMMPGGEPGWAARAVKDSARGSVRSEPAVPRASPDSRPDPRPETRPDPRAERRETRERFHERQDPAQRPREPDAAPGMRFSSPAAQEPRRTETGEGARRHEHTRKPESDSGNEASRPGERQRRMMQ